MSGSKQRFRRFSLTLGRKKKKSVEERYGDSQRDSVADQNGYHLAAPNGFMNGIGDEPEQNDDNAYPEDDAYPEDGPLYSGTHSLRRIHATNTTKSPLHFQEMDDNAVRFTLPLFAAPLGRAASAHQVGQNHRPYLSSFSTPASTQDLSMSPPVSPSKPPMMPQLSRRQRRASMSEIGYGKVQTYSKLEKLGEGTYATVFKGKSGITGQLVALKEIRLEHEEGAPCTAIREISLLKDLKHANIVALHDIIHTHNSLTLIFEFVERDLKQYMDACNGMMHINNVKLFLYQLLRGLAYCHSRRVLHRDLKPQNLLISEAGDLKLADFGLARAKSVPTKTYSNEVVTLWYRPPDVLLGSTNYSDNIDMWGVGCIFFEMACGRPMFPGSTVEEELMLIWKTLGTPTESTWPGISKNQDFVQAGYELYRADPLSTHVPRLAADQEALNLMQSLLQFQSKNRVPAKRAMNHSYFSSLGPRLHRLADTVSIFTLPECKLVINPGQFARPPSEPKPDPNRRNSMLY